MTRALLTLVVAVVILVCPMHTTWGSVNAERAPPNYIECTEQSMTYSNSCPADINDDDARCLQPHSILRSTKSCGSEQGERAEPSVARWTPPCVLPSACLSRSESHSGRFGARIPTTEVHGARAPNAKRTSPTKSWCATESKMPEEIIAQDERTCANDSREMADLRKRARSWPNGLGDSLGANDLHVTDDQFAERLIKLVEFGTELVELYGADSLEDAKRKQAELFFPVSDTDVDAVREEFTRVWMRVKPGPLKAYARQVAIARMTDEHGPETAAWLVSETHMSLSVLRGAPPRGGRGCQRMRAPRRATRRHQATASAPSSGADGPPPPSADARAPHLRGAK